MKKSSEYKEIIHDGSIYCITPCINDCGVEWLTSDEIDIDGHVCSNCPKDKHCENQPKHRKKVSWLNEIKQEVLTELK